MECMEAIKYNKGSKGKDNDHGWWLVGRVDYVLEFIEPIMSMLRFADTNEPCLGNKSCHGLHARESENGKFKFLYNTLSLFIERFIFIFLITSR